MLSVWEDWTLIDMRLPNCSADGVRAGPKPRADPTDWMELWAVDGVLTAPTPLGLLADVCAAAGSSPPSSAFSIRACAFDLGGEGGAGRAGDCACQRV